MRRQQGMDFSLEEALLWIMDWYLARSDSLNLKCFIDGLVFLQTQLSASQDIPWWTGVNWITYGLL